MAIHSQDPNPSIHTRREKCQLYTTLMTSTQTDGDKHDDRQARRQAYKSRDTL